MAKPGFDPSTAAWLVSLEFPTGYVVEKPLSVDTIFIFVMVFGYFAIPVKHQHRVLFYGIPEPPCLSCDIRCAGLCPLCSAVARHRAGS